MSVEREPTRLKKFMAFLKASGATIKEIECVQEFFEKILVEQFTSPCRSEVYVVQLFIDQLDGVLERLSPKHLTEIVKCLAVVFAKLHACGVALFGLCLVALLQILSKEWVERVAPSWRTFEDGVVHHLLKQGEGEGGDLLRGFFCEVARENGDPSEHLLFWLGEGGERTTKEFHDVLVFGGMDVVWVHQDADVLFELCFELCRCK